MKFDKAFLAALSAGVDLNAIVLVHARNTLVRIMQFSILRMIYMVL